MLDEILKAALQPETSPKIRQGLLQLAQKNLEFAAAQITQLDAILAGTMEADIDPDDDE